MTLSPELLARMVDVGRQADPTLLSLIKTVQALAHNNAVLVAEVERLEADIAAARERVEVLSGRLDTLEGGRLDADLE